MHMYVSETHASGDLPLATRRTWGCRWPAGTGSVCEGRPRNRPNLKESVAEQRMEGGYECTMTSKHKVLNLRSGRVILCVNGRRRVRVGDAGGRGRA